MGGVDILPGIRFIILDRRSNNLITILFHILRFVHIMYYLLTKEEMQMAFGGVDRDDCCRPERIRFEGIAFVVVIILLLIAMGIVF